jgi:GT2 family glycosyltransferase
MKRELSGRNSTEPRAIPGKRIAIVHANLDEELGHSGVADSEEVLVVFWERETPIGQAYCRVESGSRLEARRLAEEAGIRRIEARGNHQGTVSDLTAGVVICTRNRPAALARCLDSLSGQTRKPQQIIVLDSAPEDNRTRDVARLAGVRYFREDRPGLDVARNTGARLAETDIVAYADDDVVLHPRWLERLARAFDAPDIMAVTGLLLPGELDTPAQQIFEKHWGFGRGYQRIDFGPEYFARERAYGCPAWVIGAGASMAFRRSTFGEVGWFDERLDVGAAGCSGDSELWYRILAAGGRCRYEPSAVAFHSHRREYDALRKQIFDYMRGHVTALFVQFERHHHWGNLRRLFLSLPYYYSTRALHRLWHGNSPSNCLLSEEVKGALAGIGYYFESRRSRARLRV